MFELAGKQEYYLNGVATAERPSKFAGYSVKNVNETMRCGNQGGCAKVLAFSIELLELGKLVVTTWRDFVYVAISGTKIGFEGAVGLMGSWGKPGKFARDNQTIMYDDNNYGEEWQVLMGEPMLFHEERSPQHPESCKPAPKKIFRRFIDEEAQSAAEKACSRLSGQEFDLCTTDVMLTGDVNMAFVPHFYN